MADSTMRGVYALGILQFVATGGVILSYPPMVTLLFTYTPNGKFNATHPSGAAHVYPLELGMPSVVVSLAVLVLVSVTIRMLTDAGMDSMAYTNENLSTAGHWDALFWGVVLGVHCIFVAAVCSPGDFFACVVSSYTMVRSLYVICRPLSEDPSPTIMQNNSSILSFFAGLGVALYCTPSQYPSRYVIFLILTILDYVLVVGHCYDRTTSIQTVANCRLCWAIASAFFIAGLYGNFHDRWLLD